jgi:hypothetical protein
LVSEIQTRLASFEKRQTSSRQPVAQTQPAGAGQNP